jgi:hypothetical protein
MPHWAEIDENNQVLRVTYGEGTDEESHKWLINNLGGTWIRTYYSTPGHTFAGIGYTWDPTKENFMPPVEIIQPLAPNNSQQNTEQSLPVNSSGANDTDAPEPDKKEEVIPEEVPNTSSVTDEGQ